MMQSVISKPHICSFALIWILVVSVLSCSVSRAASNEDPSATRKFKLALPGYKFKFPQDHFSHNEYRTEWWYYTGHLFAEGGREFGFELTIFRSGVPIQNGVKDTPWSLKDIYMAHFALTDIANKKFYHYERLCRAGVGNAGASESEYKVWVQNWFVKQEGKQHRVFAEEDGTGIDLNLSEGKVPTIEGENGVSQKASCIGCASHYYSLTRMPVTGAVTLSGKNTKVTGFAWMDHEFGSNQLTADQVGWDWYSIQLDDNSELMLYVMRLRNKQYDPNSSGTVIFADGSSKHLLLSQYQVTPESTWVSPHTGGKYPSKWHVQIPSQKIDLQINPMLDDQELVSSGITYWEGSCNVSGTKDGKPIRGKAYVELTGYAKELNKNI